MAILNTNIPIESSANQEIRFLLDNSPNFYYWSFDIYLDKPDCEVVKVHWRNPDFEWNSDPQNTALTYSFYSKESVEKAISAGIDLSMPDKKGQPAIFNAAIWHKTEPVKALIDAGAPLDAVDRRGKTAIMQAIERGGSCNILKLLITSGADVNIRDNTGSTALHSAGRYGDRQMIQVLLIGGADIEAIDNAGFRPLHRAALRGNIHSTKALIENKADVNASSEGRMLTPLMCAARQGSTKIIKALLDAGADFDATDQNGRTTLQWAIDKKRAKAIQMLEAASLTPDS